MSADTGWEIVGKAQQHSAGPRLTIYANGNGYVNAAADKQFLDGAPACRVLVDAENTRIALDPVDAQDPDGYSVTREDDAPGGDLRVIGALERLGVDVDALDDTRFLSLEKEGELLVADCSELLNDTAATRTGDRDLDATTTAADDEDDDTSDEDNETSQVWCGVCGAGPFDDQKALNGHHSGSQHDGPTNSMEHEPTGDELQHGPEKPAIELTREHAGLVDTIQELAERIDVSEGRARMLARQADVADQLDDDVTPMGVSSR